MKEIIDYYGNRNKSNKYFYSDKLFDREETALKMISNVIKKDACLLDIGCGPGKFMKFLSEKIPEIKIKGIDYSKPEVIRAKKEGLSVSQGNIEEGLSYKNESFDVVYSGETIEHLFNPDFFLEEINRILKKNGFFIFSTPNLCAWFNRILMPLGIQPLFLEPSTKSKLVGAGVLKRFKKEAQPVGHVRIFTIEALKDLLKENGFEIIDIKGGLYESGLPKNMLLIDRLFSNLPSFSSILVLIAKKVENYKDSKIIEL